MDKREQIRAVINAEMGHAEKRLALKNLGVQIEYIPHQSTREMTRRRKQQEAKGVS